MDTLAYRALAFQRIFSPVEDFGNEVGIPYRVGMGSWDDTFEIDASGAFTQVVADPHGIDALAAKSYRAASAEFRAATAKVRKADRGVPTIDLASLPSPTIYRLSRRGTAGAGREARRELKAMRIAAMSTARRMARAKARAELDNQLAVVGAEAVSRAEFPVHSEQLQFHLDTPFAPSVALVDLWIEGLEYFNRNAPRASEDVRPRENSIVALSDRHTEFVRKLYSAIIPELRGMRGQGVNDCWIIDPNGSWHERFEFRIANDFLVQPTKLSKFFFNLAQELVGYYKRSRAIEQEWGSLTFDQGGLLARLTKKEARRFDGFVPAKEVYIDL